MTGRCGIRRYKNHNQSAPMKTVMHFSLDRNGVVNLDRAEQVVEVSEWVDVVDPVSNITALLANLTANGSVLDMNGTGSDFNLTKLLNENGNGTDSTGPKQKLRKRILRVPLKVF